MSGSFRRTKQDIGRIVAASKETLAAYPGPDDLVNVEDWL
jgi:hypothetical protein